MNRVQHILAQKSGAVVTISPEAFVIDAALSMRDHRIGALVVTRNSKVAGILSERDVLQRIVAQRLDPAQVRVADAMTREVVCCRIDTPLDEVRTLFMQRRIRHLPVVDHAGRLKAIISIGDLNAWELHGKEQEIYYLHQYLFQSPGTPGTPGTTDMAGAELHVASS